MQAFVKLSTGHLLSNEHCVKSEGVVQRYPVGSIGSECKLNAILSSSITSVIAIVSWFFYKHLLVNERFVKSERLSPTDTKQEVQDSSMN